MLREINGEDALKCVQKWYLMNKLENSNSVRLSGGKCKFNHVNATPSTT